MKKYNELTLFFKENTEIYNEIKNYIIFSASKIEFVQINNEILPLCYNKKIIIKENNKDYIIHEYFTFVLFDFLKEKFNVIDLNTINDYTIFLDKVHNWFLNIKYYSEIEGNYNPILILFLNQEKDWDFYDYFMSLKKSDKDGNYFKNQRYFSFCLPYLNISNEKIIDILYHFKSESGEDLSVGSIYYAVKDYCFNNKSWSIINLMVKENKTEFLVAALEGIYLIDDKKTFEFVIDLINKNNFKKEAILSLGNFDYKEESLKNKALNVLLNISFDENKDCLFPLARAFSEIIIKNSNNEKIVELCKAKIISLLILNISEIQYTITESLVFRGKEIIEIKKEILNYLYNVDEKNKGVINNIANTLYEINDSDYIFLFIENWSIYHQFLDLKSFEFVFDDLYRKDPLEFINNLIRIFIHNKGSVRYSADIILDFCLINETNRKYWEDSINNLSEIDQIKFIDSINFDSIHVKERIKLLLVLIKSKNKKILQYLFQNIIWIMMDYGDLVKECIEEDFDMNNEKEKEFYNEFLRLFNKQYEIFNKKMKLKEFNPRINNEKILNKYLTLHYQKQSEVMRNKSEEESIMAKIFKKVNIGRGKGFRAYNKEDITEFKLISQNYYLPISYLIFPEGYEFYRRLKLQEDWENKNYD